MFKPLLMNRFPCFILIACLYATSAKAQSSISFSFDNPMLLLLGGQLKYTHDFEKVQLGAYTAVDYGYYNYQSPPVVRYGLSINSAPAPKPLALYGGASVEYFTIKEHKIIAGDPNATNTGWAIGPNLGMKWQLGSNVSIIFEWAIRFALVSVYRQDDVPNGVRAGYVIWGGPTYSKVTQFWPVAIGNVGIAYTFGKVRTAVDVEYDGH